MENSKTETDGIFPVLKYRKRSIRKPIIWKDVSSYLGIISDKNIGSAGLQTYMTFVITIPTAAAILPNFKLDYIHNLVIYLPMTLKFVMNVHNLILR